MSSGVILLQRPKISFSSPLLLILRQEITAAAVALFFSPYNCFVVNCTFLFLTGATSSKLLIKVSGNYNK